MYCGKIKVDFKNRIDYTNIMKIPKIKFKYCDEEWGSYGNCNYKIDYDTFYKSKQGDLYNEDVPVHCGEEQELIKEYCQTEDELYELEDWLAKDALNAKERAAIRKSIEIREKALEEIENEIDQKRNGEWKTLRAKQKKLAEEKEKNRREKDKKKKAEKTKEEKRLAKIQAERQKAIDDMPDELKEVMDDLFS